MQVQVRDYRWDRRHLWFIDVPEFTVYEGTEVKPGKWENPEEVLCITTGNPNFPVRSIRRQYIVSIDGTDASKPVESSVRQVKIPGSKPGSEYIVTVSGGKYQCTCTGFGFRRTCKHLAMAK
jgi:hypothetical protein